MKNFIFLAFYIFLFCTIFNSDVYAEDQVKKMPAKMKYIDEQNVFFLNSENEDFFQVIANQLELTSHSKPTPFASDLVLVDQKLSKALFVTTNRRVNAEYLNHWYQHSLGSFVSFKINSQQVSIFTYKFSKTDNMILLNYLKSKTSISQGHSGASRSIASELATGNGGNSTAGNSTSAGSTAGNSTVQSDSSGKNKTGAAQHAYSLGSSFAGCGMGLVNGVNQIVMLPWNVGWAIGSNIYAAYDDPKAWWAREVKAFNAWKELISNFKAAIGSQWSEFTAKPASEQSKIWCSYLGTPAALGITSKLAKSVATAAADTTAAKAAPSTATTANSAKPATAIESAPTAMPAPAKVASLPANTLQDAIKSIGVKDVYEAYSKAGSNMSGIPFYSLDQATGALTARVSSINNAPFGLQAMWEAGAKAYQKVLPIPSGQGQGFMVCYGYSDFYGLRTFQYAFFKTEAQAQTFLNNLKPN